MLEQWLSEKTLASLEDYRESFQDAAPFKHVLMEEFLSKDQLNKIVHAFPEPRDRDDLTNVVGQKSRKHAVHDIRSLGGVFIDWDCLIQSPEFISLIEKVTGVDGLIYDPEYHGAGTHNNFHGQGMLPHIDFNYHRTTGYHRRLNLIIYLNEQWDEAWGGNITLHKDPWNPDEDWYLEYPPLINRAVIFETNEYSWHGFDVIDLPEDKQHLSRRSLTVYYYSKSRPESEIAPRHSSVFAPRPVPGYLAVGKTVQQKDMIRLRDLFSRNARHIWGIYKRNSLQMVQIDNLKAKIAHFENHVNVRTIGYGLQRGGATGVLPGGRVTGDFQASFEAQTDIVGVAVSLTVPDFVGSNSFTVSLNGVAFNFPGCPAGDHILRCDHYLQNGQVVVVEMACEKFLSRHEHDGSGDKLEVGALLNHIEFAA